MQVVGLLTTCSHEQLRHRPLIGDFRNVEIRTESGFLTIELRDQSHRNARRLGAVCFPYDYSKS